MNPVAKYAALSALALIGLGALAGCGEKNEPAAPGQQAASPTPVDRGGGGATLATSAATVTEGKKDLKEAVCVVCAVDEGTSTPEPVRGSIEYPKGSGRYYYFCNEGEKAEFISSPSKYAKP
jgi:hypothetical protein